MSKKKKKKKKKKESYASLKLYNINEFVKIAKKFFVEFL